MPPKAPKRPPRRKRTLKSAKSLTPGLKKLIADYVTKLAQTVRQAFDRHRAKEPQYIERVFVLQPFRVSLPAPIGELMQFGHQ